MSAATWPSLAPLWVSDSELVGVPVGTRWARISGGDVVVAEIDGALWILLGHTQVQVPSEAVDAVRREFLSGILFERIGDP